MLDNVGNNGGKKMSSKNNTTSGCQVSPDELEKVRQERYRVRLNQFKNDFFRECALGHVNPDFAERYSWMIIWESGFTDKGF